jgi:hypothetical protein
MPNQITIKEPNPFYCYHDEKHFFRWLETIDGVESFRGGPGGLTLHIREAGLTRDDWKDLLGLFMRYGVDMRGLRALVTPEHEALLKSPEAYWYQKLWG